ncbi:MAG: phosphoenolpyruvate--protein phosphotransferase [Thermodesulfobacteriota bacterium]
MPAIEATEIKLTGINASPGICIGKAYLVDTKGVDVVEKYPVDGKNLAAEIKRFKSAVEKAKEELHTIIRKTPEEMRQHAYILETHMVLLKDKMLYGSTIDTIKNEQVNAEWALKKVASNVKSMFQAISDDYLRERAADIMQVADRIMRNLTGAKGVDFSAIDKRVILVAHDLSPADTSQIHLERVKGFVTDLGGKASHTGIIARTLEIPAVLGLAKITQMIKNDDVIIVDGITGIVIINPTEQTLVMYEERQIRYDEYKALIARSGHLPAETADGFRLQAMGNIELPEEVFAVINYGGDGVGLYRTEFQYLSRPFFPGEDELYDKYKDVVEVMAPRPVTIRTLDINGDKALANAAGSDEANPALGLRAIRYCLQKPDVFKTQLRAILRAAAHGSVRVMFPLISSVDEVRQAIQLLNEAADSLAKEGVTFNRDIEVGIMIEVPSAVMMADALAEIVDFFSIGTNDLIQYSLAIDRGNRQVAYLYHPLHPAHIRMIKHVVDAAKDKGIKVFMCGEMAGDPAYIPILLGLGLDELSMNPQSIPTVKSMIRSLKLKDARQFVKEVLKQATAADIEKMVQDVYGGVLSDMIYSG